MDYRSLSNMLAVLRYIKATGGQLTGVQLVQHMAQNTGMSVSEAAVAKMASQIMEQAAEAELVIANSSLDPEAKHGVQTTLQKVATAFTLQYINSNPANIIGDVAGAIANLVILLSASGALTNTTAPDEATDLAKEVEELMASFNNDALDPVVRDVGKRHLQILATMLRHLPLFGIEAAMATYFELILKMKAADTNTTEEQKEASKPLMDKIGGLADGLKKADEASKAGLGLLGHVKSAAVLFGLLPPS